MLKQFFGILLIALFTSCGSSKKIPEHGGNSLPPSLPLEIRKNALSYLGTPYRYGGTSKNGIDCSGLIYMAFLKEEVALPRTSLAMSLQGERIDLEEARAGDLLFFGTGKNEKVINHVGYITQVSPEEIRFIHSTTSRGVIISALHENYWQEHFVMARRVIF